MSSMLFYSVSFFLLLSVVHGGKQFKGSDMKQKEIEDMYMCISLMMCQEKDFEEFKKLFGFIDEAKSGESIVNGTKTCYYGLEVSIEIESWEKFSSTVCPKPPEERINCFKCFGKHMADIFAKEECEAKPEKEFCEACNKACEYGEKMLAEKKEQGICSKDRYMKENMKDKGFMG